MNQYYEENKPGGSGDGEGGDSGGDDSNKNESVYGQRVRHQQLSALVPEHIGRGVFSTGAIVLTAGNEFVVDFLLRMSRPHQVATRVILPHQVMPTLIHTLRDNVKKYEDRFGTIPDLPKPDANAPRPSIQEVYDDLKMPEEVASGSYANACMVGHSASEFVMDFIANFFPRSSVSSRVFMSAQQVPRLLESLDHALDQFKKRQQEIQQKLRDQQAQQNNSDTPPPPDENPDDHSPNDDAGDSDGDDPKPFG